MSGSSTIPNPGAGIAAGAGREVVPEPDCTRGCGDAQRWGGSFPLDRNRGIRGHVRTRRGQRLLVALLALLVLLLLLLLLLLLPPVLLVLRCSAVRSVV